MLLAALGVALALGGCAELLGLDEEASLLAPNGTESVGPGAGPGSGGGGTAGGPSSTSGGGAEGGAGGGAVDPVCGNGELEAGEECDDGNVASGDGCSLDCQVEFAPFAMGNTSACAILADGALKCWGGNGSGQLGLGDTLSRGHQPNTMGENLPTVDLGTGVFALSVATGGSTTCALLSDRTIKCWGANTLGVLGLGDGDARGLAPEQMGDELPRVDLGTDLLVRKVVVGDLYHACAIVEPGDLKCWGYNAYGQLGLGHTNPIGDDPGEMGDDLPFVDLGWPAGSVVDVALGYFHTCALSDTGAVKCWGYNVFGQLGLGDDMSRGASPEHMGENLLEVPLGEPVIALGSGIYHVCALTSAGGARCWGYGATGRLGTGDTVSVGLQPGEVAALGDLPFADPVRDLRVGGEFACALFDGDLVRCWGSNTSGQLGQGDTVARGDVPGDIEALAPIVQSFSRVETGFRGTCAERSGALRCWGLNSSGQLGRENTTVLDAPPTQEIPLE